MIDMSHNAYYGRSGCHRCGIFLFFPEEFLYNINNDFLLRVKEVYPKLAIPPDAGNAVEIMKNRDLGVVDEMILMFFDRTCKTMTDVRGGVPAYGWTEKCTAVDPADIPDFPF